MNFQKNERRKKRDKENCLVEIGKEKRNEIQNDLLKTVGA